MQQANIARIRTAAFVWMQLAAVVAGMFALLCCPSPWPGVWLFGSGFWLCLCNAVLCISAAYHWRTYRQLLQQKTQHTDLLYRAYHDTVTGLPNRVSMEEALHHGQPPLALFLMDMDGVTDTNKILGHRAGDAMLLETAARLARILDEKDYLARYSGDKFALIVYRSIDGCEMADLAERLIQAIRLPYVIEEHSHHAWISIGIAHADDGISTDTLIVAAEQAMHLAKREGRNTFRFAGDLRAPLDQRKQKLEQRLRMALLHNTLTLAYQPIFDTQGELIAVEALTRWNDEEEGCIAPTEFIPIAEATGLIVPLSNYVLRSACQQMMEWCKNEYALQHIAVNVSVLQVWHPDFVSSVESILHETGLPPHRLELEVTESALVHDFDVVKRSLQALRRKGVRISIDDFGTGYSSLGRLRELEADVLKIDRIFVHGASESTSGIAVVQAIIEMGHSLQMKVVAEGVETAEQMQTLQQLHCDAFQGYLFSHPLAPEEILQLKRNAA